MRCAGRRAVVTGGASGIGRATARRLAAEGAGGLDIVFNNAGARGAREGIAAVEPADWDQPEDVAAAVAFLASDDAAFVTGTSILVDGGLTVGTRASWDPDEPSPLGALDRFR